MANFKAQRNRSGRFAPIRALAARRARLLGSTIFVLLLVSIVAIAIPYGTVQPHWESVFESVVFALGALWIIDDLLGESHPVKSWRVVLLLPLVGLIALALFQIVPLWGSNSAAGVGWQRTFSAAPYETRLFALRLAALTLALALLMRYTSNQRRLRALIYVVIFVGVASALFGVVRATMQRSPGFALPGLKPGMGYAQFINRNHFAFLMEMGLGMTLGLIAGRGERKDRAMFLMGATITLWLALVLSNSRGGIVSMLAQLVFVGLLFTMVRRRFNVNDWVDGEAGRLQRVGNSVPIRSALVACLAVVVLVGVVWVGGDPLASRLETMSGEISQETVDLRQGERRMEIWKATLGMIKEHPIVGVGFGAYATAISKYHDASGVVMPQQAHNDYLELLASGGVIGLALGAGFLVAFLRAARKQLRAHDRFRRAACFGALAGSFGVAVHSLFDFGLHINANALILVSLIVIATVDLQDARKSRHERERPEEATAS